MTAIGRWWARFRGDGGEASAWVAPFVSLVVVLFMSDMVSGPGRSLLPVYGEAVLGRPPYFTSMLVSLQVVFGAISAFIGGGLSDSLGHKRALLLGLTGGPVVGLGFLVHSPYALVLFWTYIGFAFGLLTVGRQTYMLSAVPVSRLGMATALVFFGLTMGSALGNSVSAPILDHLGFSALGLGMTVVAFITLFIGYRALPDVQTSPEKRSTVQTLGSYGEVLRRRPVQYLGLLRLIPTAYWGTAQLLMPLLIYRAAGTASAAAIYGTVTLLVASACQLLAGRVVDRYGVQRPIIVLAILIATFSLLTGLVTHSVPGLYLLGTLGAGAAWSLSVTIPPVVHGIVPKKEHGRTLGFIHVAWCAGSLLGTQVGGWLVDVQAGLPFIVMGVLGLVAIYAAVSLGPWLRLGTPPDEPLAGAEAS